MIDVETIKSFDLMPWSLERARGVVVSVPEEVAREWKALGMVRDYEPPARPATPQDGQPDPTSAPPIGSPGGSEGALSLLHRVQAQPKPDYLRGRAKKPRS